MEPCGLRDARVWKPCSSKNHLVTDDLTFPNNNGLNVAKLHHNPDVKSEQEAVKGVCRALA